MQVLNLAATDPGLVGFLSAFTDGVWGYAVPYTNSAGPSGKTARFLLDDFSTVEVLDTKVNGSALTMFAASFVSGTHAYLLPYESTLVARISLNGTPATSETATSTSETATSTGAQTTSLIRTTTLTATASMVPTTGPALADVLGTTKTTSTTSWTSSASTSTRWATAVPIAVTSESAQWAAAMSSTTPVTVIVWGGVEATKTGKTVEPVAPSVVAVLFGGMLVGGGITLGVLMVHKMASGRGAKAKDME